MKSTFLLSSSNLDLISNVFHEIVRDTHITTALSYGLAFIAVILAIIAIVRNYADQMTGKEGLTVSRMIKPFIILVVIIFCPKLYEILNGTFNVVNSYYDVYLTKNLSSVEQAVLTNAKSSLGEDSAVSLWKASIGSVLISVFKTMMGWLNWLVDLVAVLYININDLALGLFAPIAVVFTLFKETSSSFIVWLRLFIKFRIFMLAVLTTDFLGSLFMVRLNYKLSYLFLSPFHMSAAAQLTSIVNALSIAAFVVFKIIFMIMSFSLLSKILESGDLGAGGAVGGMSKQAATLVKMVATKGAVK